MQLGRPALGMCEDTCCPRRPLTGHVPCCRLHNKHMLPSQQLPSHLVSVVGVDLPEIC